MCDADALCAPRRGQLELDFTPFWDEMSGGLPSSQTFRVNNLSKVCYAVPRVRFALRLHGMHCCTMPPSPTVCDTEFVMF